MFSFSLVSWTEEKKKRNPTIDRNAGMGLAQAVAFDFLCLFQVMSLIETIKKTSKSKHRS
jgi:hypothetical protein